MTLGESYDEASLALGLSRGDEGAWLAFYDAHAPRLWQRVGRVMGGSSEDVADVVQATFLAAAESARAFDASRGSSWNWLCGIARHQVALHYRKQARHEAGRVSPTIADSDAFLAWLQDERHPTPPASLESAELREHVRTVLRELPEEYHVLLMARYSDGVSAEKLALESGTTGQAMRSKLARARHTFIELFNDTSSNE